MSTNNKYNGSYRSFVKSSENKRQLTNDQYITVQRPYVKSATTVGHNFLNLKSHFQKKIIIIFFYNFFTPGQSGAKISSYSEP